MLHRPNPAWHMHTSLDSARKQERVPCEAEPESYNFQNRYLETHSFVVYFSKRVLRAEICVGDGGRERSGAAEGAGRLLLQA